ncbi:MAG: hypothetical protein E2P01_09235 [Acidobacteria bacterium]|nr:MAG: hypothetical protein E2P01_09235 [Acidobacteriota bacterium]
MSSTLDRRRGRKTEPGGPCSLALRWLARRPLTEAEIRKRLAGKGFSAADADRTVDDLVGRRLLDDDALALDFVVLRSSRLRLGKGRLMRELEQRGVDAGVADRAYRQAVESGELDPENLLRESVARRLQRDRDPTAASSRRIYNALLRAGFPAAELYAELKRQRAALDYLAEY